MQRRCRSALFSLSLSLSHLRESLLRGLLVSRGTRLHLFPPIPKAPAVGSGSRFLKEAARTPSLHTQPLSLSLCSEKLHLAGARPPGFTNDDDDAPLSSRIKFSVFSAPPTSPFLSQSLADILARLPLPAGSL